MALVRLGIRGSKNLILINMLMSLASEGMPEAIINISLRRGKEAEMLAPYFNMQDRADELFFLGLLSLVDVIMKRPMKSILMDVPLEEDVINALLGERNDLSVVLDLLIAHEKDDMVLVRDILINHNIDIDTYLTIYIESTKWADNIFKID